MSVEVPQNEELLGGKEYRGRKVVDSTFTQKKQIGEA